MLEKLKLYLYHSKLKEIRDQTKNSDFIEVQKEAQALYLGLRAIELSDKVGEDINSERRILLDKIVAESAHNISMAETFIDNYKALADSRRANPTLFDKS